MMTIARLKTLLFTPNIDHAQYSQVLRSPAIHSEASIQTKAYKCVGNSSWYYLGDGCNVELQEILVLPRMDYCE
jgi:hypothetical protein